MSDAPPSKEEIEAFKAKLEADVAAETTIELVNPESGEPFIKLDKDGKVFIRGEEVADNKVIYDLMYEYLTTGDNYKSGYEQGKVDAEEHYREAVTRAHDTMKAAAIMMADKAMEPMAAELRQAKRFAHELSVDLFHTLHPDREPEGFVSLQTMVSDAVMRIHSLENKLLKIEQSKEARDEKNPS